MAPNHSLDPRTPGGDGLGVPSPSTHRTEPRADMVKVSLIWDAGTGKRFPHPASLGVKIDGADGRPGPRTERRSDYCQGLQILLGKAQRFLNTSIVISTTMPSCHVLG